MFTYQKTLLHAHLLLVFEIVRSLQCIHKLRVRFITLLNAFVRVWARARAIAQLS